MPRATLRQRMERHRDEPEVCLVPRPDGPARLRPGELRRHRRLADRTTAASPIDASGVLPGGRAFDGPGGAAGRPADRRGVRPLPRREDAHLRPRPGARTAPTAAPSTEIVAQAGRQRYRFSALVLADRRERPVPDADADREERHEEALHDLPADGPPGPGRVGRPALLEAMTPRRLGPASPANGPDADGVRVRPERGPHARLDARDRGRLRPAADPRAARPVQRRPPGPERADARPGPAPTATAAATTPGRWPAFLTGTPPRKTDGADLRAGDLGRSARRREGRPGDPVPVAGDRLRGRPDAGECDHGYSCAYQIEPVVAGRIDARRPRRSTPGWSSSGSSAAGPGRGRPRPAPAGAATEERPRLRRPRTPGRLRGTLGRRRPPQAGRVPDRRPRGRAADRRGPGRRSGSARRESPSRPASRPTTASTSG